MNCSNCGTPVPPDERFCRNCGQEVVELAKTIVAPAPIVPPPPSNITQQYNPHAETARDWPPPLTGQFAPTPAPAQPRRSPLLIPLAIASIVLAIAALGVLVYFITTRSQEGNERASGTNETPQATVSPLASKSSATPSPTVSPSPTTQPTVTPTPTPKPTPNTEPPPGARLGYCNDTNVFVRNAPDLNAKPITKITRGQKLWVISTSSNYSTWNGVSSNWTQVQLYNSSARGWVFSPFVSY
jgi:RNA polymerase subunit RPABC4/transcription elongation factor Spt4